MDVFHVRIPPEVRDGLYTLAKANNTPPSTFVRQLIVRELSRDVAVPPSLNMPQANGGDNPQAVGGCRD
jgi:hypothetical protein